MKISISNKLQFFTENTNLLYYKVFGIQTVTGLSPNYTLTKNVFEQLTPK